MPRPPVSALPRPWIATAIQGWGLELGLGMASFVVLGIAKLIISWGPYFVLACVGFVLWQRPDLRQRYRAAVRSARQRRAIDAALFACEVVGRDGRTPKVEEIAESPAGLRVRLSVPAGLHAELLERHAPAIAAALAVRAVRVRSVRENARLVDLAIQMSDPFPALIPYRVADDAQVDLWKPVPIGLDEDGRAVSIPLPEHNLLLGGEPGSGKSVALSVLLASAAMDPEVSISLLDGKQVELAAWSPIAGRFVGPDQSEAIELLEELVSEMTQRYEHLLAQGRRKIDPGGSLGLHLLVIDELALYLRGGKKADRDRFAELLRDLVSRGRAAGIIVVAATQKPSHEIVPTWIRDLFAFRWAMRCSSSDASDTILGSGWAQREFSAAEIDPGNRGVGYLLAEGGIPQLIKTPYVSDDEIARLVARALQLRGGR